MQIAEEVLEARIEIRRDRDQEEFDINGIEAERRADLAEPEDGAGGGPRVGLRFDRGQCAATGACPAIVAIDGRAGSSR